MKFPSRYFHIGLWKYDSDLQNEIILDAREVLEAVNHYWHPGFWCPDTLWNCVWMSVLNVSVYSHLFPQCTYQALFSSLSSTPPPTLNAHSLVRNQNFCSCFKPPLWGSDTLLFYLYISLKLVNICVQNSWISNAPRRRLVISMVSFMPPLFPKGF